MLVLHKEEDAARAALGILREIEGHLDRFGLSAGIGIHAGVLVEGLIGSREVKGYDVIGDTVNTAKRICDSAAGGEVLISEEVRKALGSKAVVGRSRQIKAKGKTEPLTVYALQGLADGEDDRQVR